MSSDFPNWFPLLASATSILVVVALWVGLICMGRARRGAAWWVMLVGVILFTPGAFVSAFGGFGFGGLFSPLGFLVFGIGFAMHGLRAARARTRLMELEQVTGAMSEELERIRKGGAA